MNLLYIRKSLTLLDKYKNRYLIIKITNIFINIIALIEAYFISIIVTSIIQNKISLFKRYLLFFLIYYLIFRVINYLLDTLSAKLIVRINNNVKKTIFYSYFSHFQYSSDYNSAKLNNVFLNDYNTPVDYLNCLFNYLSEIIILISMLFILIRQNILFLYTVLLVIPIIFINMYYAKKIKAFNKIDYYYSDLVLGIVKKVTNGIYEIASNEKIKSFITDDFDNCIDKKILNVDELNKSKINLQYLMELVIKANIFLFYALAGALVFKKQLNPEIFMFLSFYIQKVLMSIINITGIIPSIQRYHLSLDRVFEIIEKNQIFEHDEKNKLSLNFINKLEIEKAEFKIGESCILENIDLHLNKGEHILIEGENGSGKSSLIKLISLQYPLTEGSYLINDKKYSDYKSKDIMRNISISSQKPVIYPLSIKDNILYEINDTSYNLNEILMDFDLFDYIEKLESGIDTFIDENYELSGGQKKKIELIRCLTKDASIYILDEPLANLDHKFEAKFDYILNKYLRDKTVIMIEHGGYRSNFFDRYHKFIDEKLEVSNG